MLRGLGETVSRLSSILKPQGIKEGFEGGKREDWFCTMPRSLRLHVDNGAEGNKNREKVR